MNEWNPPTRPILSVTIRPKAEGDREKLEEAARGLSEMLLGVGIKVEAVKGGVILSAKSQVPLTIVEEFVRKAGEPSVEIDPPKVLYFECVREHAEAEGKYIRQTGGAGNYGHVKLGIRGGERGAGNLFVNEVQNAIPEAFIESIEEGVREALESGLHDEFPLDDVVVTLSGGSYHEADSNDMAFRIAAGLAVKEAAIRAKPFLLEPVMWIKVETPNQFAETILEDLSQRRSRIDKVERLPFAQVILGVAPLAELLDYQDYFRSATQGWGQLSMRFARYEATLSDSDSDADDAGITANKPNGPRPRINRASVQPDFDDTDPSN